MPGSCAPTPDPLGTTMVGARLTTQTCGGKSPCQDALIDSLISEING
jgi:hypothetical protein